jgi:hypothetical protein
MAKKNLHDTLPRPLEGEELEAAEAAHTDQLRRDLHSLERS